MTLMTSAKSMPICSEVSWPKETTASPEQLTDITEIVKNYNSNAPVYVTSYCRLDIDEALEHGTVRRKAIEETTNTYRSRPNTFTLRADSVLKAEALKEFLNSIAKDAYRIKGFVKTDEGVKEVSAVGDDVQIREWPEPETETNLIVISAVGVSLLSSIIENSNKYLEGALQI